MTALAVGALLLVPHAAVAQVSTSAGDDAVPAPAAATPTQASPAPATASSDDATANDIVVTGISAAIQRGLRTKRNADSIVDSISSEDIGKFPDNNIAEAVQRIPGVAIDRSGGEGRFISINGLGPDFSLTLLNGRQVATSEQGRSFAFDTIASQMVSAVNVYKTANPNVPEGGLGGTIDIRTARPFDYPGFKLSATAQVQYEQNSKKASPQGSFFITDRFLDGRLGLLASFTHQQRKTKRYTTNTGGAWLRNLFVDPVTEAYVDDTHEDAWRAWNVQYGTVEETRERNSGTLAAQFAATDTLTVSADYLYSSFKVKSRNNTGGAYLYAVQDSAGTVRDENGSYLQLDVGIGTHLGSYSFNNNTTYRPTTTHAAGLNFAWTPSDSLKGSVDLSWSRAVNNNRGRDRNQTLEMINQPGYSVFFPEDGSPYFDTLGFDLAQNTDQLRARTVTNSGTYVKATNKQVRADFTYKFSPTVSLAFGGLYGEQKKGDSFYITPTLVRRLYQANGQAVVLDGSVLAGTLVAGDKFGIGDNPFPVFLIDPAGLRAFMANPVNLAKLPAKAAPFIAAFHANGDDWTAERTSQSYLVAEKDFSAYAELHLDTELGTMPFNLVGGLRYTRTSVNSSGSSQSLIALADDPGRAGFFNPVYADNNAYLPVSEKTRYDDWLPSFNAKLEVARNVIVRGSVSRTMGRPTLEDLAPSITYTGFTAVRLSATSGNPALKPFKSTNFDASAEWYYSPQGSLALAGFYKDVDGFIIRRDNRELVESVVPTAAQIARYGADTLKYFQINRPFNSKSAKIKGFTAAWTHTLDMGLGAQLNYTHVTSNATTADDENFAVPGISNTANAVLFYEKGPLSARIALNWRSRFLVSVGQGNQVQAIYASPYKQVDARIGYEFTPGFTFSIESVNLTHEKVKMTSQHKNQFVAYDDYGRQFLASVTAAF